MSSEKVGLQEYSTFHDPSGICNLLCFFFHNLDQQLISAIFPLFSIKFNNPDIICLLTNPYLILDRLNLTVYSPLMQICLSIDLNALFISEKTAVLYG